MEIQQEYTVIINARFKDNYPFMKFGIQISKINFKIKNMACCILKV
jgi:hypothetical protein